MQTYLTRYIYPIGGIEAEILLPKTKDIEESLKEKTGDDLRKIINDYETEMSNLKGLKKLRRYFNPIKTEDVEKYLKYVYAKDKLVGYVDKFYEEQELIVKEEQRKKEVKEKAKLIEIDLRTIDDYAKFKKQEYEPITINQINYVQISTNKYHRIEELEYLAEHGVDAIVQAQFLEWYIFGIPVRRLPKSL